MQELKPTSYGNLETQISIIYTILKNEVAIAEQQPQLTTQADDSILVHIKLLLAYLENQNPHISQLLYAPPPDVSTPLGDLPIPVALTATLHTLSFILNTDSLGYTISDTARVHIGFTKDLIRLHLKGTTH